MDVDPDAGLRFAQDPRTWMDNLSTFGLGHDDRRDFLVRRCYLNPNGSKTITRSSELERFSFGRFRAFMTRSGLEVIDCPPLTQQGKNAADIRMVIDIVDALGHTTHFDEFVLLSGDADFVPLLQRIRSFDRRTLVASSSQTANVYRSITDHFVDEQSLIALTNPSADTTDVERGAEDTASPEDPHLPIFPKSKEELADLRQRAAELTLEEVAASSTPVMLSNLGQTLRNELGNETIRQTRWLGAGTMRSAISGPATSHLRFSQHCVWDPERHDEPAMEFILNDWPPSINEFCTVTGMPSLFARDTMLCSVNLRIWPREESLAWRKLRDQSGIR